MVNQLSQIKIVLVRPQYPENVGFVARGMKVFGCERLVLVAPQFEVLDVAHKTASGAGEIVDHITLVETLPEALADVHRVVGFSRRDHRIERPVLLLDEWVAKLDEKHPMGEMAEAIALVFGPENFGLSNEDKSFCEQIVCIPSAAEGISLNLSHAVSIVLYALFQRLKGNKSKVESDITTAATHAEVNRLIALLVHQLEQAHHFKPETKMYKIERLKNLIMRLQLSQEEYHTMMGVVKSLGSGGK